MSGILDDIGKLKKAVKGLKCKVCNVQPITVSTYAEITKQGRYYLDTIDGGHLVGFYDVLEDGTIIYDPSSGSIDLSPYALKANVLELDNTDVYTPTLDYHPVTKKYHDDNSSGGAVQDFTNLQNHFTYIKNADTNSYGLVGFNAPENAYQIDDNTLAVVFRYNNENDLDTVLVHTAVAAVGGLVLYDVTDKAKPIVLSTYKDVNLIGCMSIAQHGTLLYVMSSKKGRLHVLDISDRNNIVKVSDFQYEPSVNTKTVAYRCDIHQSGKYVFVCGRYEASLVGRVYSIDVTDPANLSLVTTTASYNYWLYDLRSIGNKLHVTAYGTPSPGMLLSLDISPTTGVLSNSNIDVGSDWAGVSNILHQDKLLICEWNNFMTIHTVDPETQELTLFDQYNSPNPDDNRFALLYKHDLNLLAYAGYTSNRVGLQIYNKDFTVLLGTSYIDHASFNTMYSIRWVGDYLYVLNKEGTANIMIFYFDYNSFAVERIGHA